APSTFLRHPLCTLRLVPISESTPVENAGARAGRFCGLSDQYESHFAIASSRQSNRRRTEVKLRFWIALVAQFVLFASLKLFDDWTLEWMPVYFVACAILDRKSTRLNSSHQIISYA